MPAKLCTMARLSLAEIRHKKILAGAALLTLAFLALFGLGLHLLRGQGVLDRLAAVQLFTMGLFLAALLTAVLAVAIAAGAVAGEIETGTAHALLARPISRPAFLLGKYLGYAAFMILYGGLLFAGLWGLMAWQGGVFLRGIGEALGLFLLQPLILLGLTFLAGTVLSTLGAGVLVFLLYGVSLMGGMVEQMGALLERAGHAAGPTLVNLGIVASLFLPVDALYRRAAFSLLEQTGNLWRGIGAMGPFGIASIPSPWMVLYAGLYLVTVLWLAVRCFRSRDV